AQKSEQVAARHHRHGTVLDELDGERIVAGGNRVLNRLAPHFARRIPAAGAPVQVGDLVAHTGTQAVDEELAPQMVVAVPGAATVKRHKEDLLALQFLEDAGILSAAGYGTAQRRVHLVEDGRLQEEVDHLVGLGGESVPEILCTPVRA